MAVGILGGSGLYEMEELKDVKEVEVNTPFGAPSDLFVRGELNGQEVYFLPRHGRGHRFLPHEINYKANIYAFKKLGVKHIISISAVGSLHEGFRPRDIVLPDQYFDRTKGSDRCTFFGRGIVAHIPFAEPTCHELRKMIATVVPKALLEIPDNKDIRLRVRGTYVNMEGPAFSTKAESNYYRNNGFDLIGMTSLSEAKLCREAEICYACMAMVTDYDCWNDEAESVSVELVIKTVQANVNLAKIIVRRLIEILPKDHTCCCQSALKNAIQTNPKYIPEQTKQDLSIIIGKYIK